MSNPYAVMIITMAKMAPPELLASFVEKGLKQFKEALLIATSDEDRIKILEGALEIPCLLLLLKLTGGKDPMKLIEEVDKLNRVNQLIHPNTQ